MVAGSITYCVALLDPMAVVGKLTNGPPETCATSGRHRANSIAIKRLGREEMASQAFMGAILQNTVGDLEQIRSVHIKQGA
jgi:hypothetical protein